MKRLSKRMWDVDVENLTRENSDTHSSCIVTADRTGEEVKRH